MTSQSRDEDRSLPPERITTLNSTGKPELNQGWVAAGSPSTRGNSYSFAVQREWLRLSHAEATTDANGFK